jgi:hypothetical protein
MSERKRSGAHPITARVTVHVEVDLNKPTDALSCVVREII